MKDAFAFRKRFVNFSNGKNGQRSQILIAESPSCITYCLVGSMSVHGNGSASSAKAPDDNNKPLT